MKTIEKETVLTPVESAKLENCELIIEQHFKSFVSVGRALSLIRDGKLYRETHKTFEAYVKERWGFSRVHAHRIIEAAGVVQNIEKLLPAGNKPETERQARELAVLPEDEQAVVWSEIVQDSEDSGEPITAPKVAEKVRNKQSRERLNAAAETKPKPKKKGGKRAPTDGETEIETAASAITRLIREIRKNGRMPERMREDHIVRLEMARATVRDAKTYV